MLSVVHHSYSCDAAAGCGEMLNMADTLIPAMMHFHMAHPLDRTAPSTARAGIVLVSHKAAANASIDPLAAFRRRPKHPRSGPII